LSPAPLVPFSHPIHVGRPLLPDQDRFVEKLRTIWSAGWLTNGGAQHAELEERLRHTLDVPCLSLFNNATMALLVACKALRLTGEVITTPFTFPATPHVLDWNHLTPVFADIDPITLNLDHARIEALITPRTSAVLAVHVYGTPCDVEAIQDIADRHGLKVIYDAAHAFGVNVGGKGIGAFGDASAFSFHATKLFHTAEGGALTCRDPHLAARVDLLRNFGIRNAEDVELPGLNGKMNELQAALGLLVLEALPEERRQRLAVARAYETRLAGVAGLTLRPPADEASSLQYFVIRIDQGTFGCSRDQLQLKLRDFNVLTRKYFYPLCSDYPCYRDLPSAEPARLPVARAAAQQVLCLPLHAGVSTAQAETICRMIRSFASPDGAAAISSEVVKK
jgi:dTDP-4-amino-4,6-dideoxygalactose transaminase